MTVIIQQLLIYNRAGGSSLGNNKIPENKYSGITGQLIREQRFACGKDGLIMLTGNSKSPAVLSHEYGHNLNYRDQNLARKMRDVGEKGVQKNPTGVFSNGLYGATALNEEVTASRRGLKQMEGVLGRSATAQEKLGLNAAADTYKYHGRAGTYQALADKINIPSRRSSAGNTFSGYTVKEQLSTKNNWPKFRFGGKVIPALPGRAIKPKPILPEVNYTPTQFIK